MEEFRRMRVRQSVWTGPGAARPGWATHSTRLDLGSHALCATTDDDSSTHSPAQTVSLQAEFLKYRYMNSFDRAMMHLDKVCALRLLCALYRVGRAEVA